MLVKLNKTQLRSLRVALYLATEWERTLIEAHVDKYGPKKYIDGKVVNRCKSNIAKFKSLDTLFKQDTAARE